MKAIQISHNQELQIINLEKPQQPQAGEILLKLVYVGFCGSDINTFMGRNTMALNPVIPGHEVGAVIEAVGSDVPEYLKPGMVVTCNPYTNCGKNVMVESGGITWLYNAEFYPFPSAVKSIREAADLVGMDKLMWGSDYPRTITAITYRMSYDFIIKSKEMTEDEKTAFLGGNAKTFYGFGKLPELPYIKNMSE